MLLVRRINVPSYSNILDVYDAEPGDWKLKEKAFDEAIGNLNFDENLSSLHSINEDDKHNSLTLIANKELDDGTTERYLIYWSSTSGTTLLSHEINVVWKVMSRNNIKRCIVLMTCDKRVNVELDKSNVERIEVFSYVSFIANVLTHKYGVADVRLLDREEWDETVSQNFILREMKIPVIHSNDPLVRYLGAVPGDILMIVRKMFLSGSYSDGEILYRKVDRYLDKDRSKGTGICLNSGSNYYGDRRVKTDEFDDVM